MHATLSFDWRRVCFSRHWRRIRNSRALVSGHVSGLVLAHDRALAMYDRVRDAVRSQYWMLVVMIGFTSLGLWLLSAVNT